MSSPTSNLRGIAFMVLATLFFSINDSLMKLATQGLPPFEVLFLRGVMASAWATPVILLTDARRHLGRLADGWVTLRNFFEVLAVLCFVVSLARMPIADITAIGQLAPMLLLIGVSVIYRDKIGPLRMLLVTLGFAGALLVAQPSASGVSGYAVLALFCAVGVAARDIAGRKVNPTIPAMIVVYNALLFVMLVAGGASLLVETPVMPSGPQLLTLACSGFFLCLGHIMIFLSYRAASTAAVAPFYYLFAIWAVILGWLIFGTLPNLLAAIGIALILASGLAIVFVDRRRKPAVLELEPVT